MVGTGGLYGADLVIHAQAGLPCCTAATSASLAKIGKGRIKLPRSCIWVFQMNALFAPPVVLAQPAMTLPPWSLLRGDV
jgi:hypothetical protein